MKHSRFVTRIVVFVLIAFLTAGNLQAQGPDPNDKQPPPAPGVAPVSPEGMIGPGFTYQGQLTLGGQPVTNTCDFQFDLWDSLSGTGQIGVAQTVTNIPVSNGLFTVQVNGGNQFGPTAFDGQARWLGISVRCPAGSGTYTPLSPRQQLTAAPYAMSLMPGTSVVNTGSTGAGLTGTGYNGLAGMSNSPSGNGLYGYASGAATAYGVWGQTLTGAGVAGNSDTGPGVMGSGNTLTGTVDSRAARLQASREGRHD